MQNSILGSAELTSLVTAIALILSYKLTPDESALLGNVFAQLGDTLATIAARESLSCAVKKADP